MSFYLNAGLDESRARIEGASFSSHPEILVYIVPLLIHVHTLYPHVPTLYMYEFVIKDRLKGL